MTETQAAPERQKKAKGRSPNYPKIGLSEAIEGVKAIYAKDHVNKMAKIVVAQHLKYNSLNGASLGVISALAKYGLLETIDDTYKVSKDAIAIIVDPPESEERKAAIRRAALRPALFAELHQHYGGRIPSEENMRAHLQKQAFLPDAASTVARSFRDTMELVSREGGVYDPSQAQQEPTGGSTMQPQSQVPRPAPQSSPPDLDYANRAKREQSPTAATEVITFRVSPECAVTVQFSGPVTQRAIKKLMAQLDLAKDDYPEE